MKINAFLLFAVIASVARLAASDEVSDEKLLHQIKSNWQSRAQRFHSAEFVWTSNQKVQDLTARTEVTFRFDAKRRLLRVSGEQIPFAQGEADKAVFRTTQTELFDGKHYRSLITSERYNRALVNEKTQAMILPDFDVYPILWACGKTDSTRAAIDLDQHAIEDADADLDGTRCVLLKGNTGGTFGIMRYVWLDRERDFVIRRFVLKQDRSGVVCHRLDIDYEEDPKHGWLPRRWRKTERSVDSGPSRESAMTAFKINRMFAADAFQVTFPKGTLVRNASNQYRIHGEANSRTLTREEAINLLMTKP